MMEQVNSTPYQVILKSLQRQACLFITGACHTTSIAAKAVLDIRPLSGMMTNIRMEATELLKDKYNHFILEMPSDVITKITCMPRPKG